MPSVRVWGGVSVLNALFTRRGSAMAIRLPMFITVERANDWKGEEGLVRLESMILNELGEKGPMSVSVSSDIPKGVGLKSSSALTVGLALASMKALGMAPDPFLATKISAKVSLATGLSYTGAWDDAYASSLGGLVLSDNRSGKLIMRAEAPESLSVVIYIRNGAKKEINLNGIGALRGIANSLVYEILSGNVFQAILINGILMAAANGYEVEPILELMKSGALAAGISGNGPAYFGIFRSPAEAPELEGTRRIVTAPVNEGFKVIEHEV